MKRFSFKRLSAALMALVIMVSLVPAASAASADIEASVDAGDEVSFDRSEFLTIYDYEISDDTLSYLKFTDYSDLDDYGYLYAKDGDGDWVSLNEDDLDENIWFYYYSSDISYDGDCRLDDLTFVADDDAPDGTLTLEFTLYGRNGKNLDGVLYIEIGEVDGDEEDGDITYYVDSEDELIFDPDDFYKFYDDNATSGQLSYVRFTSSKNLKSANGTLYYRYGYRNEESFSANSLYDNYFYYDSEDVPQDDLYAYPLEDLSFVAAEDFDTPVTLTFRAYRSSSKYEEGTLVINPEDLKNSTGTGTSTGTVVGNIQYSTTAGSTVQIKASDISRFFNTYFPSIPMQYVLLNGVPSTGSLYYNYYNTSSYGVTTRAQLTSNNCRGQVFYASPTSTSQFALTELTYVPNGSNYCAAIPFTAYGSGSRAVSGAILICVTNSTVSEVYSVTPKNTSVNLPVSSIYSVVAAATGSAISSIQFLSLPASSQGYVYAGSTLAKTSTNYNYFGSAQTMNQIRFVPASNFTGSVELPYVAFNSAGKAIASGKYCIGVVNSIKKFSDVPSNFWCYKYVTELSDVNVVSGYNDGSFKPNNTITYGAALKLIMLAAGYPEQAPTIKGSTFSGYLAKAQADGLITRSNVNLNGPITRLQVAQLAAQAMKLNVSGLSSVKPFTDTADVYVQALNAAGIVEGYFANGTSTFKPNNTLTRGQVSAIVWRMQNYKG